MLATTFRRALPLALLGAALAPIACGDDGSTVDPTPVGAQRQYGTAVTLGNGRARAYVLMNDAGTAPAEIGVALDSAAMIGLPAPMQMPDGGPMVHGDSHEYLLQLPTNAPQPYQFVELDWNPQGHGAPYAAPHFDFHFYTISLAERNAIDPKDPQYAAKAGRFPAPDYIRPNYACPCTLLNLKPEDTAVPHMGQHLIDVTSPELAGKPFTTTMINGTWDGKVIFQEPMITRAFMMANRDTTIALPSAKRASPAGWYPGAYRIWYDAQAKEYRIALTSLAQMQ